MQAPVPRGASDSPGGTWLRVVGELSSSPGSTWLSATEMPFFFFHWSGPWAMFPSPPPGRKTAAAKRDDGLAEPGSLLGLDKISCPWDVSRDSWAALLSSQSPQNSCCVIRSHFDALAPILRGIHQESPLFLGPMSVQGHLGPSASHHRGSSSFPPVLLP